MENMGTLKEKSEDDWPFQKQRLLTVLGKVINYGPGPTLASG